MRNRIFLPLILIITVLFFCSYYVKDTRLVHKEIFGKYKGKKVYLITLTNKRGNVLRITNFGAKINWIEVPDKNGIKENVTLGYDTFEETLKGSKSAGAIIGRYANRIAGGKFTLDSIEYKLNLNNGTNSIHGGPAGWSSVVWDTEIIRNNEFPAVKFSYLSSDMEEGFPGNVNIDVVYTWTDNNEIIIDYTYSTDRKTVVSVTNHAFFNLRGDGRGNILDYVLRIKALAFTPVDSVMIPTGEIRPVAGTPFDFTYPRKIGESINEDYDQLRFGHGYDHNYVLDNREEPDVIVYDKISGRVLEVITDQPGMQLFTTGNRSWVCFEAGHFPDSPNHQNFPSTVINPGDIVRTKTIYKFSCITP